MNRIINVVGTLTICMVIVFVTGVARAEEKPEIFVQMGHTNVVTCAVFSPDGKYLLSGSVDNTMKLWDVVTGKELRTFSGPTSRITSIAVSPDGRYAISGDEDFGRSLKLWDVSTGKKMSTFSGIVSPERITCVAFSPDGKYVLSGGDSTVKLWDIALGKKVRTFYGSSAGIQTIVLSPDGKYVISGSRVNSVTTLDSLNADGSLYERLEVRARSKGNTITVWEVASGKLVRGFNDAHGWVQALAISPDGKYVISGDIEDSVRVWDVGSGRQIKSFNTNGTSSIAISPDCKYALFGGFMAITLWNISAGVEIQRIKGPENWVSSVAFSPDKLFSHVLSAGDHKSPKLWDIATGKQIMAFGGIAQEVASVLTSLDGKRLFVGQRYEGYGLINIWEISSGRQIETIKNNLGMLSMAINGAGTLIGAGGWDFSANSTTADFWDIATGKQISTLKNSGPYWVHSLTISPDQMHALWTDGPTLLLSDIMSGKQIRTFSGHEAELRYAAMSSDGKYAVSSDIFKVNIWEVETGKILKTYSDQNGLEVCSNGKTVLIIASKGTQRPMMTLWDFQSNKETMNRSVDRGIDQKNIAISPDGRYAIAVGNWNLSLWDIAKGKQAWTISGQMNLIEAFGISPDGQYLYSGGGDGTTRFWDISTGKEIARFVSFANGEWIVITPEGYFNASPNGAQYLNVRVGNNVYSIDNFYEKFYNPSYVASVLQGKKKETVADIRKGFALPPEVTITSPAPNTELKSDVLTITITAKDMGGGIDEIRLYQNGKAIGEDARGMKLVPMGNEVTKTYTVTLVDGVNTLRASAFSKDRTESNPYKLTVHLTAPQKDVSMHIVAAGINTYKNPALNLNYAQPDAKGIVDFFKQKGGGLFKNVETSELYNEHATKESILSQLGRLQNTNPQDVVLIYLAGHGENINDKWYFIPYELTYPEQEEVVTTKAISSDELRDSINKIKAQKILMLIDACKSGAVLVAFRGFEDRKALSQLSRSTGMYVVAASAKNQFAAEVKELGHGVFTYILLQGLNGKAAGKGETVTVLKLIAYVGEQMPAMTKKYNQEEQYPVMGSSQGMDFPLAVPTN